MVAKVVNTEEIKIEYPSLWEYKAILNSDCNAKNTLKEIINDRKYAIKKVKKSSNGNYVSYTVAVMVNNDEDRREIFENLKQHKSVKFVL